MPPCPGTTPPMSRNTPHPHPAHHQAAPTAPSPHAPAQPRPCPAIPHPTPPITKGRPPHAPHAPAQPRPCPQYPHPTPAHHQAAPIAPCRRDHTMSSRDMHLDTMVDQRRLVDELEVASNGLRDRPLDRRPRTPGLRTRSWTCTFTRRCPTTHRTGVTRLPRDLVRTLSTLVSMRSRSQITTPPAGATGSQRRL